MFIKKFLKEMKEGYTQFINGQIVTKWEGDVFEVGTCGHIGNQVDFESACIILTN